MINLKFFPSRKIAFYTVRLFLTRSLAVLVALILILTTLDLLGESGKILAVPGNSDADLDIEVAFLFAAGFIVTYAEFGVLKLPNELLGVCLGGTFLFIALSDLLPEVQFHRHDRVPLSLALVFGVVLMGGIALLEGHDHHGCLEIKRVGEVAVAKFTREVMLSGQEAEAARPVTQPEPKKEEQRWRILRR